MAPELVIGKCKGCERIFKQEKLTPVTSLEPIADGFIRQKEHLCPDCLAVLEEGIETKTQKEKDQ